MAKNKINFAESMDEALGTAANINNGKKTPAAPAAPVKKSNAGRPKADKTVKISFAVNLKTADNIADGMYLRHCNRTDFINLAIKEYAENHKAEYDKLRKNK